MTPILSDMTTPQLVTLIGVILSFIVGTAGLWVGIRNTKKTMFINSVTAARIKYIQELRDNIAELCGLAYRRQLLELAKGDWNIQQRVDFRGVSDKLKYLIALRLNPEDREWDEKIIGFVDDIRDNGPDKIDELIIITQYLLKFEWEGAKRESQKGILSKRERNKLYRKYVRLYNEYIQNKKK
jgi:hypothetical protein